MLNDAFQWKFQNELRLEDFVWDNLEVLLDLKPLARLYYLNSQVCDILAVGLNKQLTILELKNTEDRHIIQQLTRYYDAILEEQPFREQVNYKLSVRLQAISPKYHKHNLIDLRYSKLTFELMTFSILSTEADCFSYELQNREGTTKKKLDIPQKFHQYLYQGETKITELLKAKLFPPKSLSKLTKHLSSEQIEYVLNIRDCLLKSDEGMREKGYTTRTVYGLKKGDKDVYKTRLCAEFKAEHYNNGVCLPQLRLRLPYPKRELMAERTFYKNDPVKGLAWVEIKHEQKWNKSTPIKLFFYLGKSESYSYSFDLKEYSKICEQLTDQKRNLQSVEDLLMHAAAEWRSLVSN